MGRLLERALRAAAERAAAPGGIRFTERQLYYELCRGLAPWHRAPRRPAFTPAPPLRYPHFRAALRRLGGVPGLLPAPLPAPAGPPPAAGRHTPEPDLFDYGLPRLLVCESGAIAGMLRANGLPMESACPVFGADELPLHPGVAAMLARAERATVFLLHDASARGLAFPARLAALTEIPDGVRVLPLGLRPRQAAALHLPRGRGNPGADGDAAVPPGDGEHRWLARGYVAEVAAVRPASLLRTVHRLVREVRPARRRPPGALRRARDAGFLSWPTA